MRTVRSSSRLLGSLYAQWGVCPGGSVRGEMGFCPADIPLCEQNDWQMGVKTLPCRNYVADGKNTLRITYLPCEGPGYVAGCGV